jgi:Fe2+ or Zn2+ uptake regulation protein
MDSNEAVAHFRVYLEKQGLYCTHARLRVARAALGRAGPFEAPELWHVLREAGLGLSTVYRTLTLLERAGVVRRVSGDSDRFVVVFKRPETEYFRCTACGGWTAFNAQRLVGELMDNAQRLGFTLHRRALQLEGLCRACKLERYAPVSPARDHVEEDG